MRWCLARLIVVSLVVLVWTITAYPPNIIILLADDLGYGDLSISPFNTSGILTPELQKMALDGVVMTNFHVAAPVCTPSRAAILSGLFPWRLGIRTIFGTGDQAHDYLLTVPNLASMLRSRGYYTAHIGKWHLGGLKPSDIAARVSFQEQKAQCPADVHPGPNQHGFEEYVSMAEGPGSVRLNILQPNKTLYRDGAKHLIRNDIPLPPSKQFLTERQVDEAIRIIQETNQRKQPLFLQLWFDAPHTPWEIIPPFHRLYPISGNADVLKYATMVSSMDDGIGRLRRAVKDLEIDNNTLIVFLSDNGPEEGVGSAAPFRGRKRSLLEGGIRVPAIWTWPQHIDPNRYSDKYFIATDILPTMLDIAGWKHQKSFYSDGRSIATYLLNSAEQKRLGIRPHAYSSESRISLWYSGLGALSAAGWSQNYKLVDVESGKACAYDMVNDPYEFTCISVPSTFAMTTQGSPATIGMPYRLYRNIARKLKIFVAEAYLPSQGMNQSTHFCGSYDVSLLSYPAWRANCSPQHY